MFNRLNSINKFIHQYKTALIWALFVLLVCGINGAYLPKISWEDFISPDKLAHLALFGMQSFLILKESKQKSAWTAAIISSVYGVFIEILQATIFVGRTYDYADMLANVAGALLFSALGKKYLLWKK